VMFSTRVCVEGNIGSGKSELLRRLRANQRGITVATEPVDVWSTYGNHDWLGAFLSSRDDHSATMLQLVVLISYMNIRMSNGDVFGVCVTERSVMSSVCIFCKLNLPQHVFCVVNTLYERLIRKTFEPHAIVYIRTPPEACMERIRNRDRDGEADSYTIAYLRDLHRLHDDSFLTHPKCIYVVDGTRPPADIESEVAWCIDSYVWRRKMRSLLIAAWIGAGIIVAALLCGAVSSYQKLVW
jgi:deoxyadenosine/deoxycytidine kinase